jgi:hypothetical protein
MSKEDACTNCYHKRSVHTLVMGDDNTKCTWPNCKCRRFEEWRFNLPI